MARDVTVMKKLLIANRGEIVVRVIRTCRKLGIKTVAVYSDADRNMFYLKDVDEARHIGPSNPVKSYLNIDAILEAAKASGADAVHLRKFAFRPSRRGHWDDLGRAAT